MSDYRLQIVHARSGKVAAGWEPGDKRVEVDPLDELLRRVKAKGVGVFRGEAHVLSGVREAFGEMLQALKERV